MKSVIVAAVLMVTVLWGSAVYTEKLIQVSMELVRMNEEAQQSIEQSDFEGAREKIDEMSDYLSEKEGILAAMGNHTEIDNIRMNLSELSRFSGGEMQTDALAKSEVLEFLYRHLPKNYMLKIENIL